MYVAKWLGGWVAEWHQERGCHWCCNCFLFCLTVHFTLGGGWFSKSQLLLRNKTLPISEHRYF